MKQTCLQYNDAPFTFDETNVSCRIAVKCVLYTNNTSVSEGIAFNPD